MVGLDENYIPYANVLAESISGHRDFKLAVLLHTASPDSMIEELVSPIIKILGKDRISIFIDNTDISTLSPQNRKGYFTLLRYALAKELSSSVSFDRMLIPDIDLVVKSDDFSDQLESFSGDVGLLMVARWPRPWLRFTAPLVVASGNESGRAFVRSIAELGGSAVGSVLGGSDGFLWGVDQAALQIAHDRSQNTTFSNVIPLLKRNILLAQDFGQKSKMLNFGLINRGR